MGNKENVFLLGDFNIDVMKNDIDTHTSTLLDTITSNLFVPQFLFLDLISIDWDAVLKLENENPNQSFNDYSIVLNTLVDKHMLLRKVTLKEIKQQYKPWIKSFFEFHKNKREVLQKIY